MIRPDQAMFISRSQTLTISWQKKHDDQINHSPAKSQRSHNNRPLRKRWFIFGGKVVPAPLSVDQDLSHTQIHDRGRNFKKPEKISLKIFHLLVMNDTYKQKMHFFVGNNLTRNDLLPQSQVNDASLSAGYPINLPLSKKSLRQTWYFLPSHARRCFSPTPPFFMSLLISMAFPSVCVPHTRLHLSQNRQNVWPTKISNAVYVIHMEKAKTNFTKVILVNR